MLLLTPSLFLFFEVTLFLTVVLMHLVRKNSSAIMLYVGQSLIIVALLFLSSVSETSILSIAAVLATLVVKVLVAPHFFLGLIKRHRLTFAVSTYLNTPVTLAIVAGLTMFAYSRFLAPFATLASGHENALALALAMMFISLFLVINRKGVLSQALGILSLENAIVSFALIAGIEQGASFELGILFDITVWIAIASIFAALVYRHFGSLDATAMRHLTEE